MSDSTEISTKAPHPLAADSGPSLLRRATWGSGAGGMLIAAFFLGRCTAPVLIAPLGESEVQGDASDGDSSTPSVLEIVVGIENGEPVLKTLDRMTGKMELLSKRHDTIRFYVDHGDTAIIRVVDNTGKSTKLDLHNVRTEGGRPSTMSGSCDVDKCWAELKITPTSEGPTSCDSDFVATGVAFHVHTTHDGEVKKLDPLVIIVPKKCKAP